MKYTIISLLPVLLFGAFLACQPSTESQQWGGEFQLYPEMDTLSITIAKTAVDTPEVM